MYSQTQITKGIRKILKRWDKMGYGDRSINCGNCDVFAQEILDMFPQGKTAWGEDIPEHFQTDVDPSGHIFFYYNGLYYDSESPKGVSTPDQLQFYQRVICIREKADITLVC